MDVAKLIEQAKSEASWLDDFIGEEPPAGDLLRELAAALETLQRERDEADNDLVDRYRDPKTGAFSFPADVAAIVRRLDRAERDRDEAREALKPFAQVLVYSFEDDPGKIHVTYAGETLTVLELDSDKGFAALKLEQDLAKARATLTQGG